MSKGILWDNDGILTDTERLFYEINRDVLAEHGVDLSIENYVEWFLVSNRGAWHVLSARGYAERELSLLRSERNQRYGQLLANKTDLVRPGLAALLTKLRSRARMAIVTASFRDHLELAHRGKSILHHFDVIVTKEHTARSKPAPDCYLNALGKLNLRNRQCIAIEDSPRGLTAALSADLQCIVMRSPFLRDYPFVGAVAVVDDLNELSDALDAFLAS